MSVLSHFVDGLWFDADELIFRDDDELNVVNNIATKIRTIEFVCVCVIVPLWDKCKKYLNLLIIYLTLGVIAIEIHLFGWLC